MQGVLNIFKKLASRCLSNLGIILKILLLTSLIISISFISSCGVKGDLYLPDNKKNNK